MDGCNLPQFVARPFKLTRDKLRPFEQLFVAAGIIQPSKSRTMPSSTSTPTVSSPANQLHLQNQQSSEEEHVKSLVRERQWIYLGPIIAAPLAHISVTLYRSAKTPAMKQTLLWGGIVGTTATTIAMRLYLMAHAGYAGGPNHGMHHREKYVSQQEKHEIENPSVGTIIREAFRGFG